MLNAVGTLIPIAVAVAISTIPILTAVALLLSREKRNPSMAYLLGWVLGLFGVAALFSLGLSATPKSVSARSSPTFGVAETVIGLVLLALGAVLIFRRSKPKTASPWIDRLSGIGAYSAFGVGVLLNLRVKALLLAAAAGLAVNAARPTLTESLIALAIYTVIGCATVAVPVLLTLAKPAMMEPRLRQTRDWIQPNQRMVTAIVVIMVGAVITGNGLTNLNG